MRESEERYRQLVELSPDAIFMHDGSIVLYANAAMLQLLGMAEFGEIIGHSPLEFIHPDQHEHIRERMGAD